MSDTYTPIIQLDMGGDCRYYSLSQTNCKKLAEIPMRDMRRFIMTHGVPVRVHSDAEKDLYIGGLDYADAAEESEIRYTLQELAEK